MQPPRRSLLFLLLALTALIYAETTFGAATRTMQPEPYILILLGGVLIVVAIGLRYLIKRKSHGSSR